MKFAGANLGAANPQRSLMGLGVVVSWDVAIAACGSGKMGRCHWEEARFWLTSLRGIGYLHSNMNEWIRYMAVWRSDCWLAT
ncbi:MAG: hypothetical protein LAT57_03490 [Balneolales bacterium]|nr:hypothetical protein [Balneolales bacterium]